MDALNIDLPDYSEQYAEPIKALRSDMDEIGFMRLQIMALAISCTESLTWYTGINQKMIELVRTLSQVASGLPLFHPVMGYEHYLRAKEFVGMERGLITGTLSNGKFAPGIYKRLVETIANQRYAMDTFFELAPQEDRQLHRQLFSDPVIEQFEQMRQQILAVGTDSPVDLDIEQWLMVAAQKLDLMKQVEKRLIARIQNQANEILKETNYYYSRYLLLVVIALISTLWVGYRLIREIILRSQLEQELREGNDRLLEAEQLAHFGNWTLDLELNELSWSDEVYRIFGLQPQQFEATYEAFLERVHPEDRDMVNRAYQSSIDEGSDQYQVEHRVVRADNGVKRTVMEQCYHIRDRSGVVIRSVGVVHDITERKQSERLKRQKEAAEAASEAKDNFLATMSHELRTPLTAILGNTELLLTTSLDIEQREMTTTIERSARNQLELVNDILDLSKIESGKFTIEPHPFDLQQMVDELLLLVERQLEISEVELQSKLEYPFEHLVVGDQQRIRQILLNLLSNAVKFTEQGRIVLTVSVIEQQLHFVVKDSGIGMSREVQQRLFRPFEQADQSISRRFGGTGLGLYISQSLAQLMGGRIEVESELGRGSTFSLILPYEAGEPRLLKSAVAEERVIPQLVGNVLLAEDTPELQLLVKRILRKCGLEIVAVDDGRKAVDRVQQQPFDLILMDMQMPVMDGVEATRLLRSQGVEIPIIALTANVMAQHRQQFEEAGCSGFVAKPINKEVLYRKLAAYLPVAQ